jgi:hypothetical protein
VRGCANRATFFRLLTGIIEGNSEVLGGKFPLTGLDKTLVVGGHRSVPAIQYWLIQSNAPVERLFALDGHILTPRHNRLSEERFEMLL